MLRQRIYLCIILSGLLFISCEDVYELGYGKHLTPSIVCRYLRSSIQNSVAYSYNSHQEDHVVESINTSWQFSELPEWFSISPSSGSATATVTLKMSENMSADQGRSAIFCLNSTDSKWQYSRTLYLSQGSAPPYIGVENPNYTFGGAVGSKSFLVDANCSWSATSSYSWISLTSDLEQGILTVSVSENTRDTYREGVVYVSYGTISVPVYIKQAPAGITSSVAKIECENVASSYKVEIESEAEWHTFVSDSWIKVTPDKGSAGKSEMYIEVAPNTQIASRDGYVALYVGYNVKCQIEINQKGIYLTSEDELHFPASEQSQTFSIQSNTEWQVLGYPNWVSLSGLNGSGDGELSVTVLENPNSSMRFGEIVLGQLGLDMLHRIQVIQDAKTLKTSSALIEFSDKGGIDSVSISSNSDWTSVLSDSWFSANPLVGTGDAVVKVSATENLSDIERSGSIKYTYADTYTHVVLNQMPKYLTIDNNAFDFPCTGGTHSLEILTNDKWTAEIEDSVDWLHLSSETGDSSATVVLTVDRNPTINVRSTTVKVNPENVQGFRILVSQQPQTLSLNMQKMFFYAKGGTSDVVEVKTDGKYSLDTDLEWISIQQQSEYTFTVTAQRNETNDFRKGKIKITLLDLVDCSYSIELPVEQAGEGGSFIKEPYSEDEDWDKIYMGEVGLTISKYSSDMDWNHYKQGGFVVNVTGYTNDHDWNRDDKFNGSISIIYYGLDKDWNPNTGTSNGIGLGKYGEDSNWNNYGDASIGIGLGKYGNDKDWNQGNNSTGNIGKDDYGNDKDWNQGDNSSGDIGKDDYGTDENWNRNNDSSGYIDRKKYKDESNWD